MCIHTIQRGQKCCISLEPKLLEVISHLMCDTCLPEHVFQTRAQGTRLGHMPDARVYCKAGLCEREGNKERPSQRQLGLVEASSWMEEPVGVESQGKVCREGCCGCARLRVLQLLEGGSVQVCSGCTTKDVWKSNVKEAEPIPGVGTAVLPASGAVMTQLSGGQAPLGFYLRHLEPLTLGVSSGVLNFPHTVTL